MKIRGWLIAAAAVILSAQCAFAGTLPDEYIDNGYADPVTGIVSAETKADVFQQWTRAGVDPKLANRLIRNGVLESISGTNTELDPLSNELKFIKATQAGLFDGTAGAQVDASVMDGHYAVGGARTGMLQAQWLAASDGVVGSRLTTVLAERKSFGDNSALASSKMNENFANRIWASPFYSYSDMDAKDGYEGYKYKAWGASLGYDRAFGALTMGAAFTYARGDYEVKGAHDDNTIDNYGLSIYAQYYNCPTGIFFNVTGGYNYGDNEWKRTSAQGLGQVRGENHTNTWWAGANIGKDFSFGNLTLTPTVGLIWAQAESSAYRTGGALGQNIGKIKDKALMLPVDLTVDYTQQLSDCSSVSFKVSGGYAYNFKNDGAKGSMTYVGSNTPWAIRDAEPGRGSWNVGAGIKYRVNNFDIGVDYRYSGKKKYDGHRVNATVGWSF